MLDQLAGGHAVQRAMVVSVACGHWGGRRLRLGGRGRSTCRYKQGGEWEQVAHGLLVARLGRAGKLVPDAPPR
jgi:hypothetical protein